MQDCNMLRNQLVRPKPLIVAAAHRDGVRLDAQRVAIACAK
jgi:hypothetical protein